MSQSFQNTVLFDFLSIQNTNKQMRKIYTYIFVVLSARKTGNFPGIRPQEADGILNRGRRANTWHRSEEIQEGNIEQECVEEKCNTRELLEIFESSTEQQARSKLQKYKKCKNEHRSGQKNDGLFYNSNSNFDH